jgi:hypothetical protein
MITHLEAVERVARGGAEHATAAYALPLIL